MIQYGERGNQIIMASTPGSKNRPFYTDYHTYRLYKAKGEPGYSWSHYNFVDVLMCNHPVFKPDLKQVQASYDTQSLDDFIREYGGFFAAESAGYFSAYLISKCERRSDPIQIENVGDGHSEYVMGVDPGQQESNFAFSIIKVNKDHTKHVVKTWGEKGLSTPKQLEIIRQHLHLKQFRISKLCIDQGGGGLALRDLLMYPWIHAGEVYPAIVEPKNMFSGDYDSSKVLPILDMINFTPIVIDQMYSSFKADMENGRVVFPVDIHRSYDPELEKAGRELRALKSEMRNLMPKPTTHGLNFIEHPTLGKDRITSLVLANLGYNALHKSELGIVDNSFNLRGFGGWIK